MRRPIAPQFLNNLWCIYDLQSVVFLTVPQISQRLTKQCINKNKNKNIYSYSYFTCYSFTAVLSNFLINFFVTVDDRKYGLMQDFVKCHYRCSHQYWKSTVPAKLRKRTNELRFRSSMNFIFMSYQGNKNSLLDDFF